MNIHISPDSVVKSHLTSTIDIEAIRRRKRLTYQTSGMRRQLHTLMPLAFMTFEVPKLPLMIGVYEAVIKAHPDLNRPSVMAAIANYVGGRTYLRSMIKGAPRIDLSGEPCGQFVTAFEAEFSAKKLARLDAAYG